MQKDEKYFILGGNFTLHILHPSSNRHQQLISSATELSMTTKNFQQDDKKNKIKSTFVFHKTPVETPYIKFEILFN